MLTIWFILLIVGLPRWLSGKESACNARAAGEAYLIPGSGRSSWEGHGNPPQYSRLGNPMNRGAWQGVAKSQTWLKWLSTLIVPGIVLNHLHLLSCLITQTNLERGVIIATIFFYIYIKELMLGEGQWLSYHKQQVLCFGLKCTSTWIQYPVDKVWRICPPVSSISFIIIRLSFSAYSVLTQ